LTICSETVRDIIIKELESVSLVRNSKKKRIKGEGYWYGQIYFID